MNKKNGLSAYRIKKIMWLFCVDVTATQASQILGLNRNTINRYFGMFRQLIYEHQSNERRKLCGVVECDESFFGPARLRGRPGPRKRGRGTLKQPVFGIFERNGRVYTEVVPDCSAKTLQGFIRGNVDKECVVHTDGWRGYDGLVDVGYDKHLRVNKSKTFVEKGVHINGIEAFWSFTKRRLTKFNGVKKNFDMHLKECEWRWKQSPESMLAELSEMTRNYGKLSKESS
jgi:transposase-like protein